MIKAVLFDLDGTLVNSLDDIASAVNNTLAAMGHPTHPTESFKIFAGNGIRKMIERALPENARDEKTVEKTLKSFFEYYGRHCADLSYAYEGITDVLKELKNMGIRICVVSNKAQRMTDLVVPAVFGSEITFDAVVGQNDGIPCKPQPHMAYVAMNEIDVNADECLFVGDSYTDILTGNSAGNVSVGVLWGFRDLKELKDAGARFIIKEPKEIISLIKEING